jgi:hypothetical protein
VAPTPLKIKAARATERLTMALMNSAARGLRPHCSDPETSHIWLSEHAEERARAARLCAGCPVELECWDAARARDKRFGVWAAST